MWAMVVVFRSYLIFSHLPDMTRVLLFKTAGILTASTGRDVSMAEYTNLYGLMRENQLKATMLEIVKNNEVRLKEQQAELDASFEKLQSSVNERAERGFAGKHVCVELLDGKHDGMILDSQSGDTTERELVKLLRFSSRFEHVQAVETDTEVFVQLRPRVD